MRSDDTVTIHHPLSMRNRRIAIFYLHGGGLLYGERDDLPKPYINRFLDAGYTLICSDYPLAPESPLPDIVDAVFETWRSTIALPLSTGEYEGYFLFGRSAGAYLSLLLAREISHREQGNLLKPFGVLDFYGYHTVLDNSFSMPAKAYVSLPDVPRFQVDRLASSNCAIVTSGPKAIRYALYVHARQHQGAWLDLMGLDGTAPNRTPEAWSLSDEDISRLPPLFITSSSGDEDIPFRLSKELSKKASGAVMKPVYYLPHDFDRDTSDPTGNRIYSEAIAWMGSQIEKAATSPLAPKA